MSLADELARFDPSRPLESARTIPNTWYTSPEIAAVEAGKVFSSTWQMVGRAEQVATPVEFFGVFNLPAAMYLGFLSNHSIHHRGELTTYLRPMGSKVPSIYGGSYDEPFVRPAPAEAVA